MDVLLLALIIVLGGVFFHGFYRAARFARAHEEQLKTLGDKTTWWLRLFARQGYGAVAEPERKAIARQLLISGALFFAVAAAARLIYAPG